MKNKEHKGNCKETHKNSKDSVAFCERKERNGNKERNKSIAQHDQNKTAKTKLQETQLPKT